MDEVSVRNVINQLRELGRDRTKPGTPEPVL